MILGYLNHLFPGNKSLKHDKPQTYNRSPELVRQLITTEHGQITITHHSESNSILDQQRYTPPQVH